MGVRAGVYLTLVVALASISVLLPAEVARADSGDPFCAARKAKDYERPLRLMPAEKPPPFVDELPFGPRNLAMFPVSTETPLAGSEIGYVFAAKGGGRRTLHTRWDVTATMIKVDIRGNAVGPVKRIHRRLPKTRGTGRLRFAFPAHRPGLYTFRLKFKNLDGKRLAVYWEHYRVLAPRVSFRLRVRRRTYRPGQIAHARVENLGTIPVALRRGVPVERAGRDCWAGQPNPLEPSGPGGMKFSAWLGPGEASSCIPFRIPRDAKPGVYRYKADAEVIGREGRWVLTAPFRVVRRR